VKKTFIALAAATMILWAGAASAHVLWVSLTESLAHPPGHVLTSLGFGHAMPMDDLLSSPHGTLRLQSYDLIAPDMKKAKLGLPEIKVTTEKTDLGLPLTLGDIGLRKIGLTTDMRKGVYQVAAASVPTFFTQYVNNKGKVHVATQPMNEVSDMKQVMASMKYQSFAKTYFTNGKWEKPTPLGHELEIMPSTDMSNLHAGDLVEFDLTFRGVPVESTNEGFRFMMCTSNTFGGPDGFHLGAIIVNGKARFRIPTAGQWMVFTYMAENVATNPKLSELKGKAQMVYTTATLFFNVKP